MGLFSSKKKTYVNTSVQRVIEDNLLPTSLQAGLVKALFGTGDIPEHILEELVQSLALKIPRMYEAAQRETYPFGIPTGALKVANQGSEAVREFLGQQVGSNVSMIYYQFLPLNTLHAGWYHLQEDYGYIPATNELPVISQQVGFKAYLKDMQAVYATASLENAPPEVTQLWGPDPGKGAIPGLRLAGVSELPTPINAPYTIDPAATHDSVLITYAYRESNTVDGVITYTWKEGTFSISLAQYANPDQEYYQVRYSYGTQKKFWLYADNSGLYPAIDALNEINYDRFGTYLPFIYFRVADSKISEAAQESSQKLLKYLGMNYYDLLDSIYESESIGDVEQAIMMLAVPANTSNVVEQQYLFEYFTALHTAEGDLPIPPPPPPQYDSDGNEIPQPPVYRVIDIKDSAFTMQLQYQALTKKRKVGKLANGAKYSSQRDGDWHVYTCQISPTLQEEVRIYDLQMRFNIRGRYAHTGQDNDAELLIPLDFGLIKRIPIADRETLYARSLHFVFNTYQTVKIKWYEREWLQVVLVVAAVALTIFTGQGWQSIPTILAAGGMTALAWTLALTITKMVLTRIAIKLFIQEFGAEIAFLAALVAIAAAVYAGGLAAAPATEGVLATTEVSFQGFLVEISKMSAPELLGAATNLFSEAAVGIQEEMVGKLQDEYTTFQAYQKTLTAEVQRVEDLLNMDSLLDPFHFTSMKPGVVWGEIPDDFYSRTVHSGNIGVVGIDMVSSFVDTALQLPRIHTSLGDI